MSINRQTYKHIYRQIYRLIDILFDSHTDNQTAFKQIDGHVTFDSNLPGSFEGDVRNC